MHTHTHTHTHTTYMHTHTHTHTYVYTCTCTHTHTTYTHTQKQNRICKVIAPDNTSRKMQLLPGATEITGVVNDAVIILVVHRHFNVVGVGPEINSNEYNDGSQIITQQVNEYSTA